MKKKLFVITLAALLCLFLTIAASAQSYIQPGPAQRRSTFKVTKIKIKYRTSPTGPWENSGPGTTVPSDAEQLMFEARVKDVGASVQTLSVKVEIYKPCKTGGGADSEEFAREGLFAINAVGGQIVMVDHGNNNKISIIVDVHRNIICPDCPPPSTPPDPDCHPADSVRDHLGQGPYDTMMTISDTGSRTGADSNVNQTSVSFTSEVRNRRSVRRSRRTARSSFNPPPKRV